MHEYWILTIIVTGAFAAGFIDAVVGGGGLLQVPLMFICFPNMPHTNIIATNRFASVAGTTVAAIQYSKKIAIHKPAVLLAGLLAISGSVSGVYIMHRISTDLFKPILLSVLVLLALYTCFKKNTGQQEQIRYAGTQYLIAFACIGGAIGLYNGVIGPGTGTLLVFSLVQVIGLSFIHASAYAKIINAIADASSLIAFFFKKAILFKLAIPMMFANMLGGYMGSKVALRKGNQFIRITFILVLLLLIARFAWDIFLHHKSLVIFLYETIIDYSPC